MPKPRTPQSLRRVLIFGRVYPATHRYLESMDAPNLGRAIDILVERQKAIVKAMNPSARRQFDIPARLPLDQE